MDTETVIIGGGLAGLNCARILHAAGRPFVLLEAGDRCGGRVRTDRLETDDGAYLIDRGFQVLLTAYPHAAEAFDYDSLELCCFYPGAMVYHGDRFHRVADPRRRPGEALRGFRSPIATTGDKLRLAEMSLRVLSGPVEKIWSRPDRASIEALVDAGYADTTIERLFKPFFGGVFFDPELRTSSRMLEFVFRMFSQGRSCVPAAGMGELARQLESTLPEGCVRTELPAQRLERDGGGWLVHAGGDRLRSESVVVATDGDAAIPLLEGHAETPNTRVSWRSTATLAYACDESPTEEGILMLDGQGEGPVNHAVAMTAAAEQYAPPGKHLVYANVIDPDVLRGTSDDAAFDRACRAQLRRWLGEQVDGWRLLNVERIARALPDQSPGWLEPPRRPISLGEGLFACGDWLDNASIDGALASGKRCALALVGDTRPV